MKSCDIPCPDCQPPPCPAPREGCRYVNITHDVCGCQTDCGQMECEPITVSDDTVECTDGTLADGSKCNCKPVSGCASCVKKGDEVTCKACDAGRFFVDGKCPNRVECKGGNTPSGQSCKCQSGKCHRCTVTVAGEPSACEICKKSTYLHEGECLDTCPDGLAHIPKGSSQYGRTCQPALTCLKNKIVTPDHPRQGKACRCDDKNCVHCSFGVSANGPVSKCMGCTNKLYLIEGECKDSCPADLTHHGMKKAGRACLTPFDCTATLKAAGDCQCHKTCTACLWEAGNAPRAHVCTSCKKKSKVPKNGAC